MASIFPTRSVASIICGIALLLGGCTGQKTANKPSKQPPTGTSQPGEPAGKPAGGEAPRQMADAVYTNGKVYTVNPDQPWVESIAVKGNTIVFAGTDDDARKLVGNSTKT